jgi:flagellar FliL protein
MTATATRESRFVGTGGNADAGRSGTGSKDTQTPGASPKRSRFKSKKFVIGVVAVLAVGGGGYTFLKPTNTPPPSGGDVVAMDATTLNLAGGHYLKIAFAVQLMKGAASATDFSPSHAAELVIDEFSNRTVASLGSNAARKKLTADLLADIQKAYPGKVFDVFVTNFVTQ